MTSAVASGDLTQRKLIPALFHLFAKDRLPPATNIVGVARSPLSDEEFRAKVAQLYPGPTLERLLVSSSEAAVSSKK